MNRIFAFLLAILPALSLNAQIRVVAHAPQEVAEGEQFLLEYEVNTHTVHSMTQIKSIPGFSVLYGPARSSSHSYQIINGRQTSHSSTTFSYTLLAQKAGTYTLPKLTVTIEGESYQSDAPKIRVVSGRPQQSAPAQRHQGGNDASADEREKPTAGKANSNDLFITVTANKSTAYEQEPILLTYKVYTRLNLTQLAGKMPDLKGFMTKEVNLPKDKQFTIENYNGQNYYTTTWSQYVMFPQESGRLEIPAIKFDGIVIVNDHFNMNDFLDEFFNGISAQREVKKTVTAPGLALTVRPLPDRPANFSGAVGSNFTIKSEIITKQPKENETLNLRLTITGTGNMDLIKTPDAGLPSDFESYTPKQKVNSNLTAAGMSGSLVVDYIAVPKRRGHYTLPAIPFTYFDPADGTYKTIQTNPLEVDIAQGQKNAYADMRSEVVAKSDIRYIHQGSAKLNAPSAHFWNTPRYWMLNAALILLAIAVLIGIRIASGASSRRSAGARESLSRLRKAKTLLSQNRIEPFYEELQTALHGYASKRLGLPAAELSSDNIRQAFTQRNVPADVAEKFLNILSQCELYRFSPVQNPAQQASDTYVEASAVIAQLETHLKRRPSHMKTPATIILLLITFAFATQQATAATKAEADSLYAAQRYEQAAAAYEQILANEGVHADIYYNLGCAYYRLEQIGPAILNFERALTLNPASDDTRFNLALARTKTADKIDSADGFFMLNWLQALLNTCSSDRWGRLALIALALMLVCIVAFRFVPAGRPQHATFYVGLAMAALFVAFNLFAYLQLRKIVNHTHAIVMTSTVVKSTPAESGNNIFNLHEGTKVRIDDATMKSWTQISLPDGKTGWIKSQDIETI